MDGFALWFIAYTSLSRKGVAHLWKNKGVAPLRELLYTIMQLTFSKENHVLIANVYK